MVRTFKDHKLGILSQKCYMKHYRAMGSQNYGHGCHSASEIKAKGRELINTADHILNTKCIRNT